MSTSRTLIISSVLVGGISLMISSVLNFSVTGVRFFLPTLKPFFVINGIIFALAASTSLLGNGSHDSPATKHHHDDNNHLYEHDHHVHDHDRDGSSNNSSNSSSDQYNNKVHQEEKFPVRSESGSGSYRVSSIGAPVKPVGLRRPPTAPLKPFPQDDTSSDETETMEEMWERVKADKQPRKPKTWQGDVISRKDTKMTSTSSYPSPSRARKPPPSPAPATGKKLMERIPSWVKLKKELSMGREELNSRVEAFISKFKDEMKLERLESLRRPKLFSSSQR
ncbi:hypothetical protein V5N11_026290 [Cardamine amara subsp. amara]|uniref:Uncharacterized protein n=1 Tax=Cardamine amara subsp. amara TaxID=228776 RepID=A0ABD1BX13_CARAN